MLYVKEDTVAALGRASTILNFVIYGCLDLGALVGAIGAFANGNYEAGGIVGFLFLLFSGFTAYNIFTLIGLNGQERRRQIAAAASLNHRLALTGQPMLPLAPLPMPTRLNLRLRWSYAIPYYGLISLAAGAMLGAFIAYPLSYVAQDASLPPLTIFLLSALGIALLEFALMLLLGLFLTRESLEVSLYGLRVRRGFSDRFIPWDAVTLFAQVRTVYFRAAPSAYYQYELSNQATIVRFFRLYRDRSIFKPTIPFAQYAQLMDLTLAYTAARTGLPLFDVRADQPVGK